MATDESNTKASPTPEEPQNIEMHRHTWPSPLNWDAIRPEQKALYNSLTESQQKQLNDYLARNDDELVWHIKQLAFKDPPDFQKTEITNKQLFNAINALRVKYQSPIAR